MKLTKNHMLIPGLTLLADATFFSSVNPVKSPSLLLFVGFALTAFSLLLVWTAILRLSRSLLSLPKESGRKPAFILTAICVLLLALQSIGQLAIKDVLVVLALAVLTWFYFSYSRGKQA